MIKKEITFPDLDDNPVTETFYFALNEADLTRFNFSKSEDLTEYIQRVIRTESRSEMYQMFENFLEMAIGRRHVDNVQFIKNQEIKDHFMQSNAYSTLLMELGQDDQVAANFLTGIMPASIQKEVARRNANPDQELPFTENSEVVPSATEDTRPAWIKEDREPTSTELQNMTPDQLREAFSRKLKQ